MANSTIKFVVKKQKEADIMIKTNIKEISVTKDNYMELVEKRKEVQKGRILQEEDGKIVGFVPKDALEKFEMEQAEIKSKVFKETIINFYNEQKSKLEELEKNQSTNNISETKKIFDETILKSFIDSLERDYEPIINEKKLSADLETLKEKHLNLNDEIKQLILIKDVETINKKNDEKEILDKKISELEKKIEDSRKLSVQEEFILKNKDRSNKKSIEKKLYEELDSIIKKRLDDMPNYTETVQAPSKKQEVEKKKVWMFENILFAKKDKKTDEKIKSAAVKKSVTEKLQQKTEREYKEDFYNQDGKKFDETNFNTNLLLKIGKNYSKHSPKDAEYYYNLVLSKDPNNEKAQIGLQKLINNEKTKQNSTEITNEAVQPAPIANEQAQTTANEAVQPAPIANEQAQTIANEAVQPAPTANEQVQTIANEAVQPKLNRNDKAQPELDEQTKQLLTIMREMVKEIVVESMKEFKKDITDELKKSQKEINKLTNRVRTLESDNNDLKAEKRDLERKHADEIAEKDNIIRKQATEIELMKQNQIITFDNNVSDFAISK